MDTILGMNLLEFVLVAWVGCMVITVACDVGTDVYQEQKTAWLEKHPKTVKADPEITVQLPVGSFDPDTTMKLPKIQKYELQNVFVMNKRPEKSSRGRHAKA
jgi:hypothetical protein